MTTINPSGGIGFGGAGGYRVNGTFATGYIFSILGNLSTVTNWGSVTQIVGQPFTNALEYKYPQKLWKKGATSATTITLGFNKPINTLALININFSSFDITVITTQTHAAVLDNDTRIYNAFIRYSAPITNITLFIPSQTPTDGTASFSIGGILGGMRNDFTFNTMRSLNKRVIESYSSILFDAGNTEEELGAASAHELEYELELYSDAQIDELKEVVGNIGEAGYCVIYEKTIGEETIYLAQPIGDYRYSRESYGRRIARLMFLECR